MFVFPHLASREGVSHWHDFVAADHIDSHTEIIRILLAAGADLHANSNFDSTTKQSTYRVHAEIVHIFLVTGANPLIV